jgi:hypothetical protein
MRDLLKASRAAAELQFMLSQINLNVDSVQDEVRPSKYDQDAASLLHDISVLTRRAADLNAAIMKEYEKVNHNL